MPVVALSTSGSGARVWTPLSARIASLVLTLLLAAAWGIDEWRVDRFESSSSDSGSRYVWKLEGTRVESCPASGRAASSDATFISYMSVADRHADGEARWRERTGVTARTSDELLDRTVAPYLASVRAAGFVRALLVLTLVWLVQGWLPLPGPPVGRGLFLAVNAVLQSLLLAATCWFVFGGVLANTAGPGASKWNFGLSPLLVLVAFLASLALFAAVRIARARARCSSADEPTG